jgi:uncharacterized membrane protein YvbJ
MVACPRCGNENNEADKFCQSCGQALHVAQTPVPPSSPNYSTPSQRAQPPVDKLEGYWYAIIWGALAIPCVSAGIVIGVSSIMYYVWKKDFPNKAKAINRQGWFAALAGGILWLIIGMGLGWFNQ